MEMKVRRIIAPPEEISWFPWMSSKWTRVDLAFAAGIVAPMARELTGSTAAGRPVGDPTVKELSLADAGFVDDVKDGRSAVGPGD
jgi:hypothetical protein